MKALSVLALSALAACSPSVRSIPIPAELATCADEPNAPDIPAKDGTEATQMVRDTMTLGYILALREAWGSCRAAVDGVAAYREGVD